MRSRRALTSFLVPALAGALGWSTLAGVPAGAVAGHAVADAAGAAAGRAPAVAGTFPLTAQPESLVAGSDGNMWVTLSGSAAGDDLARVTPAGGITYYDLDTAPGPGTITLGPGGNLWATLTDGVVKIPVAAPTTETKYVIAGFAGARGIDLGPDGNLWAASVDKVFRIPPGNPVTATPFTVAGMDARQVAADASRVWVVDNVGARVLAFRTDGTFTAHAVGGNPQGIATGPAGQVLYTNPGTNPHTAARLRLGGTPQATPLPATDPSFSVGFGLDGAYWVGLFLTRQLARITPQGAVTRIGTFPAPYLPRHVASGPGGRIWVGLQNPGDTGAIGRVTGLRPPDGTVTVRVVGNRARVRAGRARVRLTCPATEASGPCRGRVVLRKPGGAKVGPGRAYRVAAGRTVTVPVRLRPAVLKQVRRAGRLQVRAVVTVRDTAGNQRTVRKGVRLVAPRS